MDDLIRLKRAMSPSLRVVGRRAVHLWVYYCRWWPLCFLYNNGGEVHLSTRAFPFADLSRAGTAGLLNRFSELSICFIFLLRLQLAIAAPGDPKVCGSLVRSEVGVRCSPSPARVRSLFQEGTECHGRFAITSLKASLLKVMNAETLLTLGK